MDHKKQQSMNTSSVDVRFKTCEQDIIGCVQTVYVYMYMCVCVFIFSSTSVIILFYFTTCENTQFNMEEIVNVCEFLKNLEKVGGGTEISQ